MSKKILIVEDNPSLIKEILARLTPYNHQIVYAMDGEEGTMMFDTEDPHLVILDINMPKKNGIEVLEYIRNDRDSDVPVVVFSNYSEQDTIDAANELGISEYRLKANTSLAELVSIVNRIIE